MKKLYILCGLLLTMLSASAQTVSTYAGALDSGYKTSSTPLADARFDHPFQVALDSLSNTYISDFDNNFIIMINGAKYYVRSGSVAGGYKDGGGAGNGLFTLPAGIVVGDANNVYFVDAGNNAIRKLAKYVGIGQSQYLTTVAGGGPQTNGFGASGYTEAKGLSARFANPCGITYVRNGNYLLVADVDNSVIRKVDLTTANFGQTSLYAGQPGKIGVVDGNAIGAATFRTPTGIYYDPYNGDVYVAELAGGIRKISAGKVTTLLADTIFHYGPSAICRGPNDELYISDGGAILQYSLIQKKYRLFAGSYSTRDLKDGVGTAARFINIYSFTMSLDKKTIYITDNNAIRTMTTGKYVDIAPVSALEEQLSIYPNPAKNYVNISTSKNDQATITLMDMSGRMLLRKDMQLSKGAANQFDISTQTKGMYLLNIATRTGSMTKRIVIAE